jgi:hypothetical protein
MRAPHKVGVEPIFFFFLVKNHQNSSKFFLLGVVGGRVSPQFCLVATVLMVLYKSCCQLRCNLFWDAHYITKLEAKEIEVSVRCEFPKEPHSKSLHITFLKSYITFLCSFEEHYA